MQPAFSVILFTTLIGVGQGLFLALFTAQSYALLSTLQTAIGVKHPKIAQKSQGFTGGSFNTREFFHGRTHSLLRSVKWSFLFGVFAIPTGLLVAAAAGDSEVSGRVLALAFVVQYLGLIAERWFFFAQASHPQNLYYQVIA